MLGSERRLAPLGNTFLNGLPEGGAEKPRSNSFSGYICYAHQAREMELLEALRGEDAADAAQTSQQADSHSSDKTKHKPPSLSLPCLKAKGACDPAGCGDEADEGGAEEPMTPSTCMSHDAWDDDDEQSDAGHCSFRFSPQSSRAGSKETACSSGSRRMSTSTQGTRRMSTSTQGTRRMSTSTQGSVGGSMLQQKLEELRGFLDEETCENDGANASTMQEDDAKTFDGYDDPLPEFMDDGQAAHAAEGPAARGGQPGREPGAKRKARRQRRTLPESVTTLMVHNLPTRVRQRHLAHELDRSGFAGLYDFLYMPCVYTTGCRHGYAFVNFSTSEAAQRCVTEWSTRRSFQISSDETVTAVLKLSPARVQGRDANMRKWATPKKLRVKNPNFRPLCVQGPHETRGDGPCPQAPGAWAEGAED